MRDGEAFGEQVVGIVRDYVARETASLRADLDAAKTRIAELEQRELVLPEKGERGETGERGRDADPEQVRQMVCEAVAALPLPERGERGLTGERGDTGPAGVGMTGFAINRDGDLLATLSDGTMHNLGQVVGRDGAPGEKGDPGIPGERGKDGTSVDDIHIVQVGTTMEVKFVAGDTAYVCEVELPRGEQGERGLDGEAGQPGERGERGPEAYVGEARGLFDASAQYRKLDVVSFNGSEWRAKCDDPGELPGEGWMLSAGRGKRGEKGDRGERGFAGAALAAGYIDGTDLVLTSGDGSETKVDLYNFGLAVRGA